MVTLYYTCQGSSSYAPNDIEKGKTVSLTAKSLNANGAESSITPEWSLKDARQGITLTNNMLTVATSYDVKKDDSVTIVASQDGKTSEKTIQILDSLYTYTINYYRLDGKQSQWDMWLWENNKEGAAYPFTETTEDGYAKATYQFSTPVLNIITRPGNWNSQEVNRKIEIKEGKSIEVWIVQDIELVYSTKPDLSPAIQAALMDSKNDINVTVNKELTAQVNFTVMDVAAKKEIPVITTKLSGNKVKLTIADPAQIDVRNIYEVKATGYASKKVTMRNVLNDEAFYYEGTDLGYTYAPTETNFKLWAPTAAKVSLALYNDEGTYAGAFVKDNTGGNRNSHDSCGQWCLVIDLPGKFTKQILPL